MRLLSDTGLIGVAISGTQGIANDLRKQFSFFHTNRTDWRSFWSPSTTDPSKYRKKVPECILSKIYNSSICAFHPYLAAKLPFLFSRRNKNPGSRADLRQKVLDKKGATVFPTGCFSVSMSKESLITYSTNLKVDINYLKILSIRKNIQYIIYIYIHSITNSNSNFWIHSNWINSQLCTCISIGSPAHLDYRLPCTEATICQTVFQNSLKTMFWQSA